MHDIPIIPLKSPAVLFPGVVLRIPLKGRSDIAALLGNIYNQAATATSESKKIYVGCVPLASTQKDQNPPTDQLLIKDTPHDDDDQKQLDTPQAPPTDILAVKSQDLFTIGTLAKVVGIQGRQQGALVLLVQGQCRFKVTSYKQDRPYIKADVTTYEESRLVNTDSDTRDLFQSLQQLANEYLALLHLSYANNTYTGSLPMSGLLERRLKVFIARKNVRDAGALADFLVNLVDCPLDDTLQVLAAISVRERLQKMIDILQATTKKLRAQSKGAIMTNTDGQTADNKEHFDLHFGGSHSHDDDSEEEGTEDAERRKRIDDANLPAEAQRIADRELKRLDNMNPGSAEYSVITNYLDTLASVPWSKYSQDSIDSMSLQKARKQLDHDHYGLDKVKRRLIEYVAVLSLKQGIMQDTPPTDTVLGPAALPTPPNDRAVVQVPAAQSSNVSASHSSVKAAAAPKISNESSSDKAPILLLAGPPGTGKTSLAKSVATALGRKFLRISLGGVSNESAIRGHSRTYVGAMAGNIVQGLVRVGVSNPVILLDEIDKLGSESRNGNPEAAMLEVLDPEQNHAFTDHYLGVPIDLSRCLFIATANDTRYMSRPLEDRMERIDIEGYTSLEKTHIATRYLIPKQIKANGLQTADVDIEHDAIEALVSDYTFEPGVRDLERVVGAVCRHKAVERLTSMTDSDMIYSAQVHASQLSDILDRDPYVHQQITASTHPGVVNGLAAYSGGAGGDVQIVEVTSMPGKGNFTSSGSLSEISRESIGIALSWVKAHAYALDLCSDANTDIMADRSLHIHFPDGSTPKDGPSAGVAITIALISLFSNRPVPTTIAMTGEMSLRGKVLPVGGIKAKLLGALRAGITKVLLPDLNRRDARKLPEEVARGLQIVHVTSMWEAIANVWPDVYMSGREAGLRELQSKL